MKGDNKKMFVIMKYIMAQNARQAINKDKKTPVDDCFISDDWKEGNNKNLASAIGFEIPIKDNIEN